MKEIQIIRDEEGFNYIQITDLLRLNINHNNGKVVLAGEFLNRDNEYVLYYKTLNKEKLDINDGETKCFILRVIDDYITQYNLNNLPN